MLLPLTLIVPIYRSFNFKHFVNSFLGIPSLKYMAHLYDSCTLWLHIVGFGKWNGLCCWWHAMRVTKLLLINYSWCGNLLLIALWVTIVVVVNWYLLVYLMCLWYCGLWFCLLCTFISKLVRIELVIF